MSTYNKLWIGIIAGVIAPFIGLLIYWQISFGIMSFKSFWNNVSKPDTLAAVISLCLIANLAAFYLFLNKEMLRAVQGVIAATLCFGFYILYLKLF
jgi:hypothetical protein